MPNVNVSYAEMQAAARQLQAGEQTISGDWPGSSGWSISWLRVAT